jgi:ABC-type phosphate transport system permease subunit
MIHDDPLLFEERPHWWSDRHAELALGGVVCAVLMGALAMLVFIVVQGWPSFAHNGLAWFGSGGSVDRQIDAMFQSGETGGRFLYTFHAWPLIWSTALIVGGAVALSLACSLLVAVFVVEFAPDWAKQVMHPVVRLLASVPSVIYGLIGVLVIVPFIGNHLIGQSEKASVAHIISLSGYSLIAAVLILTVMIAPLQISIFADGLRTVPRHWLEASLALGVNRWRTFWKVGVRAARPAIVAGTVLATARALGEAVMLAMVSGSVGFAPNPFDGAIFLFEPSRPLAPTIIQNIEGLSSPPLKQTLFAIASVLLVSAMLLSLAGWAAKQPLKRYAAA